MDKKQFTSWGVSFGSLALVAGMVSYLGLANKNPTNNINKSAQQAASQNQVPDQQPPIQNGDDENGMNSNFGDDQTTTDDGSSFNFNNDQSTNDNGQSIFDSGNSGQSNNQQFSGRDLGHHRGFDTTTGGT